MPTINTAVADFFDHISTYGNGNFSAWYAGITDDAERRLFKEHNVNRRTTGWIYELMNNNKDARAVEEWLIKQYGLLGGGGGGDASSCYVYAYLVTQYTRQ